MPTIIHLINKYCTTHSYPIYTYYLTSYNDQGEKISMTFTNSTDLFQRKLINYEIKNVTLDTSLSVWESDNSGTHGYNVKTRPNNYFFHSGLL